MEKDNISAALDALKNGRFVLVYDADGREGETDFIMASQFVSPESIRTMRRDGGGLIFLIVDNGTKQKLGLPYLADLFYKEGGRWPVLKELIPYDIPYDTKSSFSITINHRKTFTGITDKDRALTISEFAKLSKEISEFTPIKAQRLFGERFRSPGHVPLCNSSEKPLSNRFGHTELGVVLVTMANLTPIAAGCEMMDSINALPKKEAIKYSEEHNLVFLEGKEIVEAWKTWLE
ncbi:MAG: 3,4-dihydroxy-2-butanone-4-phosphate synthase [Methanomassiliicoccales archaeon]|nr:MAG: 3,4-dihydroxy-2-butanone-4-phosphate synthase [Methanomassiliicoccales archaeon]